MITIEAVPRLDCRVFLTTFPRPLGELMTPPAVARLFVLAPPPGIVPIPPPDDEVRAKVRDLLRVGGFKPTGRNKPASEYLRKAVTKGWLAPDRGINCAVDICNAVSLHSGLPISVVDADKARSPWRISICPPTTRYVFNPAGQEIDVGGLVTLHDIEGPCGGPVKDSQRTKTDANTTRTLSVVWGTTELPGRAAATRRWYTELLEGLGATTTEVAPA